MNDFDQSPNPTTTDPTRANVSHTDLLTNPFTATPSASAATAGGMSLPVNARIASTSRGGDAPAGEVAARANRPAPRATPALVRASWSLLRARWVRTFRVSTAI